MKRIVQALLPPLFVVAGCAHQRAASPPVPPPSPPVGVTQTTSHLVETKPAPPAVNVNQEILEACKIHFENVSTAPKFDFDKSVLQPSDPPVLDQVAKCVTTGPLKGRSLRLVGRADPRGTVEYNQTLGEERASTVRSYLKEHDVDSPIATTSRGKLDATGTDEAGWQRDRRVDVDLAR